MSQIASFAFSTPTPVEFGVGAAAALGARAATLGMRHVMIVTDAALAAGTACADALASLRHAGVAATLYSDVVPDPTAESVAAAAGAYRACGADSLVALGGGSAMDTAKALGVLTHAGVDDVTPFFLGGPRPIGGMPALICVPTTAGTGAELTYIAVVTHAMQKKVLRDPLLAPRLALVDPALTLTMPPALTAATGLDALAHALETLTSSLPNPFSDALAADATARIARWLPRAVAHGDDLTARTELALAATLAGAAFLSARLHLGHAVGHSLGTHFKLAHGLACAVCLPAILEFLRPVRATALERAAAALGAPHAPAALDALLEEVGAPRLGALTGLDRSGIPRLCAIVAEEERLIALSPRRPSAADWDDIFAASL